MIEGGSVIITDFEDVWGNDNQMGLGEHAVRIHAPPLIFDKRGNVLRWVNFESPTESYRKSGTVYRSIDRCMTGDFSLKMFSDEFTEAVCAIKTNDYHNEKMGIQCVFASESGTGGVEINFLKYVDGYAHSFLLLLRLNSRNLQIRSNDGPVGQSYYIYFDQVASDIEFTDFSTMKLIIDLETNEYIEALVFGKSYDLRGYQSYTYCSPSLGELTAGVTVKGTSYGDITCYVDNLILTNNE